MSTLPAALSAARGGLRVFPVHGIGPDGACTCGRPGCHPKQHGKHPRITGWPRLATTDETKIREWWDRWPDSNVGIVTGWYPDAGRYLVPIDLDGAEGLPTFLSLAGLAYEDFMDLPGRVRTGSGGYHLYCWADLPIRNSQREVGNLKAPGIDIRGVGGYVLAHGSRHRSGGVYQKLTPGVGELPAVFAVAFASALGRGTASAAPTRPSPTKKARKASPARRGPGRPREGPSAPLPSVPLPRETLIADAIRRWPIDGVGERSEQVLRLVGHHLGVGHDPALTRSVALGYLEYYCEAGRIGTPFDECVVLLDDLIARMMEKARAGEFRVRSEDDHVAEALALPLPWRLEAFLDGSVRTDARGQRTYSFLRPQASGKGGREEENVIGQQEALCRTAQERAFVRGLLLWVIYKLLNTNEDWPVPLTDNQIRKLMRRQGVDVDEDDNMTVQRLRRKYITQDANPATRYELLVRTSKGKKVQGVGIPSRYEPTGLGWLLESQPEYDEVPPTQAADGASPRPRQPRQPGTTPARGRDRGRGGSDPGLFGRQSG